MRVLFFADGRSIHTQRWIDAVAEAGIEVHLATWDGYTGGNDRIVVHDFRALAGSSFSRRIPRGRALEWVWRARSAARRVAGTVGPDLVHGHFVRGYGHLALFSGIHPLVVTAWGSDIFDFATQGGVSRSLTRRTLRSSDLVTCDSDALRDGVVELGAEARKVRMVQFGVDAAEFGPDADPAAARHFLGLESSVRVVLSPRAISPVYRTDVLLRAFASMDPEAADTSLVLLGAAPDSTYRDEMEKLSGTLGIADRVRFAGQQRFDVMPSMYATADVVVSLARTDSSPVSVLEAMACGRTIVAADVPGVREWISNGENGFLADPGGSISVAAALTRALALSPDRRAEWSARNRREIVERADYRTNMAEVVASYRALQADRSGGSTEPHPKASRAYWETRFQQDDSIRAVGDRSLGRVFNTWAYRGLRYAMARALRRGGVRLSGRSLCDVGAGLGAWVSFWEREGAYPVVGVDIAEAAVNRLRELRPSGTFVRADITSASDLAVPALPAESFDAVAAINVLYHLESDESFDRALENLAMLVRPGGWLIVSDGMAVDDRYEGSGESSRSVARYARLLERFELRPVLVQPLSFTLCGPLVASTPDQRLEASVHRLAARLVKRFGRTFRTEWLNGILGAGLFAFDAVLLRFADRGPTLHVLIARKDSA